MLKITINSKLPHCVFSTYIIVVFVTIGLSLLFCSTGYAETATNATLKSGTRIHSYILHNAHRRTMYNLAKILDKKFKIACDSSYKIKLLNAGIYGTVNLPDGLAHPISGAWAYKYQAIRCGEEKIYNLLMIGRNKQIPKIIPLIAGATRTSPLLQKDAMLVAVGAAAPKAQRDCKNITVFDSKISEADSNAPSGKTPPGTWFEDWTMRFCGQDIIVKIRFSPDGKGGTNFSAKITR